VCEAERGVGRSVPPDGRGGSERGSERGDSLGAVNRSEPFVHETAWVESGALIGAGTRVWHHSQVRSGARVGIGCVLGKNVFVDEGVTIGNGCKLQNNVSVYHGVTIADDVFVGPAATFTNDLVPRAFSTDWVITPTQVERGASIGANSTIVCGNTIGEYAMVAAGATVTRDVAPHELVAGTPARTLGWVCECGTVVSRASQPDVELVCDRCKEAGR
jgi:UDP-2-acetamido-3-amino-2,3-dideoxy-glucuronate N-acetyltransferase